MFWISNSDEGASFAETSKNKATAFGRQQCPGEWLYLFDDRFPNRRPVVLRPYVRRPPPSV